MKEKDKKNLLQIWLQSALYLIIVHAVYSKVIKLFIVESLIVYLINLFYENSSSRRVNESHVLNQFQWISSGCWYFI